MLAWMTSSTVGDHKQQLQDSPQSHWWELLLLSAGSSKQNYHFTWVREGNKQLTSDTESCAHDEFSECSLSNRNRIRLTFADNCYVMNMKPTNSYATLSTGVKAGCIVFSLKMRKAVEYFTEIHYHQRSSRLHLLLTKSCPLLSGMLMVHCIKSSCLLASPPLTFSTTLQCCKN
jgi:hypothetical protein